MAEKQAAACLLLAMMLDDDEKNTRGPTRKWVKRRGEEGMYANLVQELLIEDTKTYREMMRMNHQCFKQILQFIEPFITPEESPNGTKIIKPAERLVLTIRFLATGETFRSLSFQFRISERDISYIIDEGNRMLCWQRLHKTAIILARMVKNS